MYSIFIYHQNLKILIPNIINVVFNELVSIKVKYEKYYFGLIHQDL